jgi:glycosyltransferase involved in cell wall biosynthesis
MRVAFLTQYYPPETGAAQNRISDFAARFASFGHAVTVLTAMPNYPQGEILDGYRRSLLMEDRENGVRVVRTWIYASPRKSPARRLFSYFSFVVTSLLLGAVKAGPQDVIVVESPPLFLGLSGYIISRLRRAKLVMNISDLWPESAVAMGVVRNQAVIRAAERLEGFLYRQSALVTGQSEGITDSIRRRFPEKPVELITNGFSPELFEQQPAPAQAEARAELGLDGKFIVGYTGLHGLAQGLETVLLAAKLLLPERQIQFALFGDGPVKSALFKRAHSAGLANVRFFPCQPRARMPAILGALDLALVPLRGLELFKGVLPSKVFEAMGAGVAVLASVDGECRSLIERAKAGVVIEPENPEAMAAAILSLSRQPERCRELGRNGREYVIAHYNRREIALRFERLLKDSWTT